MEQLTEQEQDLQYLQDLEDYVKTLKASTPEQIALYNRQIDFMETIHNEIREKNSGFMPIYDPSLDREEPAGNKYLENVYSLGTIEIAWGSKKAVVIQ